MFNPGVPNMIKNKFMYMKQIITLLLVFLPYLAISQQVNLSVKGPEQVYSGSDFLLNIHIAKGNTQGFGRLLVKIPSGFTPSPKKSMNGEFEFDGSQVKILWIKLPDSQQFTVTLSLKAAPNLEGFKVFRSEMSIASEDGSYRAEARPHIVTVKKADNITTANDVVFEYSYIKEMGVSAIRQKPFLNDSGQAEINILVNKGQLTGFGKIEESIPPDYTAEPISSNGAMFVYNKVNRKVKFLWMNMPSQSAYIISYVLVPKEGRLENIPFIITGEFMYAEGSTTKTVEVMERNIDLKKLLQE